MPGGSCWGKGRVAPWDAEGGLMIARTWRGWVRTEQTAAYVEYITRTGLSGYRQTPGNLGAQMWTTDLGDGRTEVMTVSWRSEERRVGKEWSAGWAPCRENGIERKRTAL